MAFGLPFRLLAGFCRCLLLSDFLAACSILVTSFWIPLNLLLAQKKAPPLVPSLVLIITVHFFRAIPFWRSAVFWSFGSPQILWQPPGGREQHLCVFLEAEVSGPADRIQVNLNTYHRQLYVEALCPIWQMGPMEFWGIKYMSKCCGQWIVELGLYPCSIWGQRTFLLFVPKRGQCAPALK